MWMRVFFTVIASTCLSGCMSPPWVKFWDTVFDWRNREERIVHAEIRYDSPCRLEKWRFKSGAATDFTNYIGISYVNDAIAVNCAREKHNLDVERFIERGSSRPKIDKDLVYRAKKGDGASAVKLGDKLRNGIELIPDLERAAHWYQVAIDKQYVPAYASLGLMYELGWGVPKNYQKAFELYQHGADAGDAVAQSRLANLYVLGKGVTKNEHLAKKWFDQAAKQNNIQALFSLGYMNEKGLGGPVNYKQAKEFYTRALQLGSAEAVNNLGVMAFNGEGEAKSYGKAKALFEEAASLRQYRAKHNLALMYQKGLGVPKNYRKARKLYAQAIKQGMFLPSAVNFDYMRVHGQGTLQYFGTVLRRSEPIVVDAMQAMYKGADQLLRHEFPYFLSKYETETDILYNVELGKIGLYQGRVSYTGELKDLLKVINTKGYLNFVRLCTEDHYKPACDLLKAAKGKGTIEEYLQTVKPYDWPFTVVDRVYSVDLDVGNIFFSDQSIEDWNANLFKPLLSLKDDRKALLGLAWLYREGILLKEDRIKACSIFRAYNFKSADAGAAHAWCKAFGYGEKADPVEGVKMAIRTKNRHSPGVFRPGYYDLAELASGSLPGGVLDRDGAAVLYIRDAPRTADGEYKNNILDPNPVSYQEIFRSALQDLPPAQMYSADDFMRQNVPRVSWILYSEACKNGLKEGCEMLPLMKKAFAADLTNVDITEMLHPYVDKYFYWNNHNWAVDKWFEIADQVAYERAMQKVKAREGHYNYKYDPETFEGYLVEKVEFPPYRPRYWAFDDPKEREEAIKNLW